MCNCYTYSLYYELVCEGLERKIFMFADDHKFSKLSQQLVSGLRFKLGVNVFFIRHTKMICIVELKNHMAGA